MSEFIYCPRAGIVAFEQSSNDRGDEINQSPNLGDLPSYDVDRIQTALSDVTDSLKKLVGLLAAIGVVILSVWYAVEPGAAICLGLGSLGTLPRLIGDIVKYCRLKKDYWDFMHSRAEEPNWQLHNEQEVDWWKLIHAGFESREKVEPLYDHELKLAGKPFRVLRKGAWRGPRMSNSTRRLRLCWPTSNSGAPSIAW